MIIVTLAHLPSPFVTVSCTFKSPKSHSSPSAGSAVDQQHLPCHEKKTNWQLSIQFLFNFCAKTVIKQTSHFHGSLKDLEFPNKKCCQKIEEPLLHIKPLHIAFQSWSLWEAPPIFCQPRQSFRKIPSGSLPVCTTSDTWKIVQDTFQFMNWVHKSDWIWHWHT